MFSGKTTELIRRSKQGDFEVFKPAHDTRYSIDSLVSHGGERVAARSVGSAAELREILKARTPAVAIDEAHFFGVELAGVCALLVDEGTRVVVAGLERDHRGRPFDPMPELLCQADQVVKLSGPCARCGRPAVHSQRLFESADRIVVGGAGAYEARCRACFVPGA